LRLPRAAVALALAAAITVPTVATMGGAAAATPPGSITALRDPIGSTPSPTTTAKPQKIKFAASGTVTAVDATAGTVTVAARGGTKDVRGTTVTVSVPGTAVVLVNGVRGTLAGIGAGYRIAMTGTHPGTGYTATKLVATSKRSHPEPAETPHS
jgi:hypothetical protein